MNEVPRAKAEVGEGVVSVEVLNNSCDLAVSDLEQGRAIHLQLLQLHTARFAAHKLQIR